MDNTLPLSIVAPKLASLVQGIPAPELSMSAPSAAMLPSVAAPVAPDVSGISRAYVPPTQTQRDQTELNRRINTGSGVSQIHNPILHGLAEAGDIVSQIAGGISPILRVAATAIPGTTLHHNLEVHRQQGIVANDQQQAQNEAAVANVQAQTDERNALGDKASALALSDTPAPLSAEDAAAIGHPELAGLSISPRDRAKYYENLTTNATKGTIAAGHDNTSMANNQNTNDTRVTTTGMNNDTSRANNTATNTTHQSISDAADKTRVLVAQMHDATSQANNANTNHHKVGSGAPGAGGSFKVPADITKRAALASNVNENADAVDSLVHAHPDIVGATGGRYSTVQQMIGSDDPNIAELGVRIHNIALASNGAHGVRSQQAVQETENNLFNHFKSGPTGIHGALNGTRASMQTFLDDEKNFHDSGSRIPSSGGGNGPKVGDTKTFPNGKQGVWDGTGWAAK